MASFSLSLPPTSSKYLSFFLTSLSFREEMTMCVCIGGGGRAWQHPPPLLWPQSGTHYNCTHLLQGCRQTRCTRTKTEKRLCICSGVHSFFHSLQRQHFTLVKSVLSDDSHIRASGCQTVKVSSWKNKFFRSRVFNCCQEQLRFQTQANNNEE